MSDSVIKVITSAEQVEWEVIPEWLFRPITITITLIWLLIPDGGVISCNTGPRTHQRILRDNDELKTYLREPVANSKTDVLL
nr:7428_t:CDS:2 [Entrophospora candida]